MSKAKKQRNTSKHRALSAQQTIPYIAMHPDGICQLPGGLYTKTLEYEDINYAVASTEDQTAIISGWSACLNYFDSSLPFQLSFVNRRSRNANRYKVNIPAQEDDFNSIRGEYVEMLKGQIAKSNNGIERYKYITFGLPAEGATEARPRLGRVEADVMGNLKRLGVQSRPLDGRDRLAVLHGQMHPGGREPFRFAWKDIPKTGMGAKDYIAPDSFDFRQSRTFRVGQMWGAASYLQIMASELSDRLLAEILELDAELTVTMHIQTVDQLKAIKTIKGKISDIGRMKAEEQKKAVRAGYDMEILPPDLITFSKDAAELLSDLQSRNERMFLLTFTVVNLAPTRQRLENDVFTVSGIAQKYNCALRRLDWQQEQGFVSSLALGYNGIEIQRGMTTSSTAIFIPFMTRELRMNGQALYYGMNALSNNVIMADRKKLKSANGMYLGSTGSGKSFAAKRELINVFLATNDRIIVVDPMGEYTGVLRSGESRSQTLPHLQIITPELFEAAQHIRTSRANSAEQERRVPLNTRGQSLLAGNVFCGHCGSRLVLTTNGKAYPCKEDAHRIVKRVRYICYGKTRKQTECDGQTGYTAHILDGIIDKVVRQIFERMKAIPKSEIVNIRYREKMEERKVLLKSAKSDYAKAAAELDTLRAEVIKSLRGESAFSQDLLSSLIADNEKKCLTIQRTMEAAQAAYDEGQAVLDALNAQYDDIISWADMYDSASMEAKKMIVSCLIKRVDVYRDYKLHIDFNIDFEQFSMGIDIISIAA